MDPQSSPQSRTERLIGAGRVVLAASSLFAIWLDPLQPAKHAELSYTLMSVYAIYSILIACILWTSRVTVGRLRLVTHVIDLLAFSVFMTLTEGPPTSPFSVYFVFSILCATLRWSWQGTLWTTLASLATFIGMGLSAGNIMEDEHLNRFVMRCVYLVVIAAMLGYLGTFEQQLRGEIARLAAWPRSGRGEPRHVMSSTLAHAAAVFGAARAAMVWDEPEEPWVNAALWVNGTLQWDRHPPTMFEPLVAESLAGDIFFCTDLTVPQPRVVVSPSDGTYRRWSGPAVNRALRERYAMRAVLAVRCAGEGWEGRLFFLDKPRMTGDDVPLGKVVAHQVTADIDHLYLQQRLRQAAVMEERVRFARDLHDGLLQSLTGTALQLQTVRRLLNEGQTAALARLDEIQHLITAEQANLRSYIRELKPAAMLARRVSQSLKTTLRTLVDRIERQWGLQVELTTGELTEADAAAVAHHIAHLVHEALVNAARHGGASGATVTVREVSDHVTITVADNGRGFPFRGRYGMTALNDMGAGPASLKERTAALRGTLTVESGSGGACVEITLPLAPVRV